MTLKHVEASKTSRPNQDRTDKRRAYEAAWKRNKMVAFTPGQKEAARLAKAAYDREYRKLNAEKRKVFRKTEKEREAIRLRSSRYYHTVTKIRDNHGPREIFVGRDAKLARMRELYHTKYKLRDKYRTKGKKWRMVNLERSMALNRKSYLKNKPNQLERQKLKMRERRATDPVFKVISNLRTVIGMVLRGHIKSGRSLELIGCSREHLRAHLESQFTEGMTWENYGKNGWHVDHDVPISHHDLTDPEQQKKCFHWSNLQPLWAVDNIRKGNRWVGKVKPAEISPCASQGFP